MAKGPLRIAALAVVVGSLALGASAAGGVERLVEVVEWLRGSGPGGGLLYIGLHAVTNVALVPIVPFALGAGYLYGPVFGWLVTWSACIASATVAFTVSRRAGLDLTKSRLPGFSRFAAAGYLDGLGRLLEHEGFRIVALLRVMPGAPFSPLSYFLGTTNVGARDYVLGTAVGYLPPTLALAVLGSLLSEAAQILDARAATGPHQLWFLAGTAVVAVGTALAIGLVTRRALARPRDS